MNHYHESPQVLNDFLSYIQTIKGSSPKTVKEYYLDLRTSKVCTEPAFEC